MAIKKQTSFTGITAGQELNAFDPSFIKMPGAGNTGTIVGSEEESGAVRAGNAASNAVGIYYHNDTYTNDGYAEITFGAPVRAAFMGVAYRLDPAAGTGYGLYANVLDDFAYLFTVVGGTYGTTLWSGPLTLVAGSVLRLTCTGTTITASHNGTTLQAITDASYASGKAGLTSYQQGGGSSGGTAVDFKAEDTSVAPTGNPPIIIVFQ